MNLRLLVLPLAITFFSLFNYWRLSLPINPSGSEISFQINTGENLDIIGLKLKQANLIKSPFAFKLTVIRLGLSKRIQAGYFKLSPRQSLPSLAYSLVKAKPKQVWVTIPEGLRREQIAFIIDQAFQKQQVTSFKIEDFLKLTSNLEGYLYPETYAFDLESNAEIVVKRLTTQFDQVVAPLKLSPNQLKRVVILASLLEREAATDNEMPEIIAIFENRLSQNWPLQVDASVQFVLANQSCNKVDCDWWPEVTDPSQLQIDSPYNTYKHIGLPPSPISNPGKSSLFSAANPTKSPNWFYLHDPAGNIHYAKTLKEHNNNVCQFLKKDC